MSSVRNLTALVLAFAVLSASPYQDRLWHLRNLGKAFYENPTTHTEAVEQFRQALALAPQSARERVNYGLALVRAGDAKQGIAELEKAQKQDPGIPHTWFSLGILAKRDGDYARGIEQMRGMLKLVPREAKAHYNLGALYKLDNRAAEALKEFEEAERRAPNLAAPHFQLYNGYRQAGRTADAARELALFQEIKKRQAGAPIPEDMEANNYTEILDIVDEAPSGAPLPEIRFSDKVLASGIAGIASLGTDLFAWGPSGVQIFHAGNPAAGIKDLTDVIAIEPGDFENSGSPGLCVITKSGAALYRNDKGVFRKAAAALPPGAYRKAIWLDYDHDYDLDLFLLGEHPVLMRNNGDGTFTESTKAFPFAEGKPLDAVVFALHSESAATDLVVSYEDHEGVLYEDRLNGVYRAEPLGAVKAGTTSLTAADFNNDSWVDLAAVDPAGMTFVANRNENLNINAPPAGLNLTASLPLGIWVRSAIPPMRSAVALDWNIGGLSADGTLHYFVNQTAPKEHWLRIALHGIKNIKAATSSTVEVKAGALYQKKIYRNEPLVFPMGAYTEADTVRITWPNGLIQNEPQKKAGQQLSIDEAQRLSGSCPMIFTWDGRGFEFITDVLGVAPLGASSSDGSYFPVDHDEYVQIPGRALQARNGTYEVRISEELREVSYLDQVQLIALDHPAATEIFTNDKFKSPPFPEFRLFGVTKRVYPRTARDGRGADVRASVLRRDGQYPDGFQRDFGGAAELHTLDLNFEDAAPDGRAVLILNGWVDWADGSTFLGASQHKGGGLVFPYLQVRNASGKWQTVVEDMGIPSGKPKTIAVDLTGKFLSASREVRIVTNLCVYWDEIFLSEHSEAPPARLTPMNAERANLHFRGFSTPAIDPQRKQPERFDYAHVMPVSMWNPTPGLYTRYGDVRDLVNAIDDRLLIMGSGDEVVLHYPAAVLPPLADGWQRDFLLLVDGWAKDADANTAFSRSVEPLPFHAMSAYPYRRDERFPDDAVHQAWRREYLTRPALRLIRPLREPVTE